VSRLLEALNEAGESAGRLKREGLHICTFHSLCLVIKIVVDEKKPARTIESEVARWCERQPELRVEQVGPGMWEVSMKDGA